MTTTNPFATLGDMVRHYGATAPDAPALTFENRVTTYGELDRLSNKAAHQLMAEGIGKGDRVAILAKNTDAFFILWMGAAKAGAAFMSINYRLAPKEIEFIVNDGGAKLLFVDSEHAHLAKAIENDLPQTKRILSVDNPVDGWADYGGWMAKADESDPQVPVAADDCAAQMYTSGTTGHPKGVVTTHANLTELAAIACQGPFGYWTAEDVNLVAMPLYHIGGGGWGFLGLYHGCNNIIHREVVPGNILRDIEQHRITKAFLVPAVILFILQQPNVAEIDFSSLDVVAYGAAPMPLEILRQAMKVMGVRLTHVYGLTETTGAVTGLHSDEYRGEDDPRLKSCGRAFPGVDIRIVDDEGKDLPLGEVGEILIRSKQNMPGYWNRPEANEKSLRDNWFYTGDAGYLDEDGYLYIHDRVKDMIVSGGENIYPAEVESAIFEHPAVADAAVIGVPDDRWGESVKAIIVLKPDQSIEMPELDKFLRERIAGYKIPRSLDIVDELPRNPSGKILKRELRKPYWEGRDRQVN